MWRCVPPKRSIPILQLSVEWTSSDTPFLQLLAGRLTSINVGINIFRHICRLWSSGSSLHSWATTFPPAWRFDRRLSHLRVHGLPADTFAVPTIHGRPRSNRLSGLCQPLVILVSAWLYIEPSPRSNSKGVRPAGDPVDGDPYAQVIEHGSLYSSVPGLCHHIREPTVLTRVRVQAPFPEFWPLAPALPFTLAHPCGRCKNGSCSGRDKWELSPHHVATTYPCGQPGSSSLCVLIGGFATPVGRYHGRTLSRPSSPACATPCLEGVGTRAGSGPSQVRRRLSEVCLGSISTSASDLSYINLLIPTRDSAC